MKIYAEKFRGFEKVEVDLSNLTFLVGDNSSGKSSILYLIQAVAKNDLTEPPELNEDLGLGAYDYFSPYFNNSPVTFAYSGDTDLGTFYKIITVKKKDPIPHVMSCTYILGDHMLSFKDSSSKIYSLIKKVDPPHSFEDASRLHHEAKGYRTVSNEDTGIPHPRFIYAALDYANPDVRNIAKAAFENIFRHPRLIPPVRSLPERFYKFRRRFEAQGGHFPSMWMDFETEKNLFATIGKFGKNSGLFEEIQVKKISQRIADSPLFVTVVKNGKNFSLDQVGVGVSQVVPVLIETVFSITMDTSILVQQPELHLHPIAQAALGSYFFEACKQGLRGVLECHSSYLIDRFRADLRDEMSNKDSSNTNPGVEAKILFCQNTASGNFTTLINVLPTGELKNDPDEFHSFFIDEALRTMF